MKNLNKISFSHIIATITLIVGGAVWATDLEHSVSDVDVKIEYTQQLQHLQNTQTKDSMTRLEDQYKRIDKKLDMVIHQLNNRS